eukprot:14161478-Ditylum_brightwellii.AAC.1
MLPIVEGQQTYGNINKNSKMLYVNVATIPTTLGGGGKGHIGLIMKPTLHATFSTTAYEAPTEPTQPTKMGGTAIDRNMT